MPKCSCLGKNPDCFKCGGWGWIGDKIHENRRLDDPLKYCSSNKRNKSIRDKSCAYCSGVFANLHHHISVVHADKWNDYLKESNVNDWLNENNLERCIICGALVKKLEKHFRKKHSIEQCVNEANTPFFTMS